MVEMVALVITFVIVSTVAECETEDGGFLGKFMGFFVVVGGALGFAYLLSG